MIPDRSPDCEAIVSLLATEDGGRTSSTQRGYRPAHSVRDDYLTSGVHDYIDVESLEPGHSARTRIWFASPDQYPGSLWVGKLLKVQEGGRLVGHAEITAVLNPLLARAGT